MRRSFFLLCVLSAILFLLICEPSTSQDSRWQFESKTLTFKGLGSEWACFSKDGKKVLIGGGGDSPALFEQMILIDAQDAKILKAFKRTPLASHHHRLAVGGFLPDGSLYLFKPFESLVVYDQNGAEKKKLNYEGIQFAASRDQRKGAILLEKKLVFLDLERLTESRSVPLLTNSWARYFHDQPQKTEIATGKKSPKDATKKNPKVAEVDKKKDSASSSSANPEPTSDKETKDKKDTTSSKRPVSLPREIFALKLSQDGSVAVNVFQPRGLGIWDAPKGKLLRRIDATEGVNTGVTASAISPSGRHVAFSFHAIRGAAAVKILDLSNDDKITTVFEWPEVKGIESVTHLAFFPDGKNLLAASREGIKIWDLDRKMFVFEMKDQNMFLPNTAVSQDGKTFVLIHPGKAQFFYRK